MSADKVNKLFWLNYAQAIKDKIGADVGSTSAFFLGSEAQKGPVGGDGIPNEYTNQGIYDIGNKLLAADDLFYNPSHSNRYDDALQNVLNWADTGAKPGPQQTMNLFNAREDLKAAQAAVDIQQDKAFDRFTKEEKRGLTNGLNFREWCDNGHGLEYTTALNQLAVSTSTIEQIQLQIGGPNAVTIQKTRAELSRGTNTEKQYEGYNMPAALGNVMSPQELVRNQQMGKDIPKPSTHLVPAFSAPRYKAFIQEVQAKSGGRYEPANSIEFSIDTKDETSKFDFGQTTVGANAGFSYGGWFSFNVGGDHSESHSTLETGSDASSVRIKILYDKIEKIPIEPGSWAFSPAIFQLRPDCPDSLKTLVTPTAMVAISRLGYEMSFSDSIASSLDTKLKETTSAGGSLSILGIPINLGGSGSHSSEKTTHEAHWDSAHKTLKVVPSDDVGTATLIGLLGEKVKLTVAKPDN